MFGSVRAVPPEPALPGDHHGHSAFNWHSVGVASGPNAFPFEIPDKVFGRSSNIQPGNWCVALACHTFSDACPADIDGTIGAAVTAL